VIDGEYDIEYSLGFGYESQDILSTTLAVSCRHKKHPDLVTIKAKVMGKYQCANREELERYAPNSGASLVPFLRTYISTLTGWGPMQPLNIPLLNLSVHAVKKRAEELKKDFPKLPVASIATRIITTKKRTKGKKKAQ